MSLTDDPHDALRQPRSDQESRAESHRRPVRSGRRAWIMRIVLLTSLAYLGFVAVLYSLQTRLIFPGQDTQGQEFAQVRPRPGTELVRLTTGRGDPIVALYGPAL